MIQTVIMSLKKKKNVIILTSCMVTCFILYQLYFFLTITSETNNILVPVLDHDSIKDVIHLRSEDDKYINEHGMIRGVYYTDIKNYRPDSNNEFKCKISREIIPFERVNDDFCDCKDGSDEPSTTACPDGVFYCDTQTPKIQRSVPSAKVNDGICDCCDGSDEWLHGKTEKLLSQSSPKHYRFYVSKCPNKCNI